MRVSKKRVMVAKYGLFDFIICGAAAPFISREAGPFICEAPFISRKAGPFIPYRTRMM